MKEGISPSVIERYPYLYYLRHADNDWTTPATIERKAVVNRFGIALTTIPLLKEEEEYKVVRKFKKIKNGIFI